MTSLIVNRAAGRLLCVDALIEVHSRPTVCGFRSNALASFMSAFYHYVACNTRISACPTFNCVVWVYDGAKLFIFLGLVEMNVWQKSWMVRSYWSVCFIFVF